MIRFFISSVLVQGLALAAAIGAFMSPAENIWWLVSIGLLIIALVHASWLSLASDLRHRDHIGKLKDEFSMEREKIRNAAEKEKHNLVAETQRRISREAASQTARANFRAGSLAAAAVAIGGLMMMAQLFTLGWIAIGTAGGGVAGYILRRRHERLQREASVAAEQAPVVVEAKLIESEKTD
ncbi:MAG: hypothetical protein AAF499_19505 [Pseudomonadota bacterium]